MKIQYPNALAVVTQPLNMKVTVRTEELMFYGRIVTPKGHTLVANRYRWLAGRYTVSAARGR